MATHPLSRLITPRTVAFRLDGSLAGERLSGVYPDLARREGAKAQYLVQTHPSDPEGGVESAILNGVPEGTDLVVVGGAGKQLVSTAQGCARSAVGSLAVLASERHTRTAREPEGYPDVTALCRQNQIKLLGPDSLGLLRSSDGLDLMGCPTAPAGGGLSVVSQSNALCLDMLDWAAEMDLGFCTVVSTGKRPNLDLAELLDYLAYDYLTHGIILQVEEIRNARSFISALRVAARVKPVILFYVGRRSQELDLSVLPGDAPLDADQVLDAALERVGVIRVRNTAQLYSTAMLLSTRRRLFGRTLALVTDAPAPGKIAADHLTGMGRELAQIRSETALKLTVLGLSRADSANPVTLGEAASPDEYSVALQALFGDANVSAILAVISSTTGGQFPRIAETFVELGARHRKPLLVCCMGGTRTREIRARLQRAGVPVYRTAEAAVEAFAFLEAYQRSQEWLGEVARPLTAHAAPRLEDARQVLQAAAKAGRARLHEQEARFLLACFHLGGGGAAALRRGRLASGGSSIGDAGMLDEVASATPLGNVTPVRGVKPGPWETTRDGLDLYVGVCRDQLFGPVIVFGSWERGQAAGRTVALPPINCPLTETLLTQPHSELIAARTERFNYDALAAVKDVVLRVSEMVCEFPEIVELRIAPLRVCDEGVVAENVWVAVAPCTHARYEHMAIHPYPSDLVCTVRLSDRTRLNLRPIRPQDAQLMGEFWRSLSKESRRFRYLGGMQKLTDPELARMTQIDYQRELAFIATVDGEAGERMVADCRYVVAMDDRCCEFGLVVADDWKSRRIGRFMMNHMEAAAGARGFRRMVGMVHALNDPMARLMKNLGYRGTPDRDDPELMRFEKVLAS